MGSMGEPFSFPSGSWSSATPIKMHGRLIDNLKLFLGVYEWLFVYYMCLVIRVGHFYGVQYNEKRVEKNQVYKVVMRSLGLPRMCCSCDSKAVLFREILKISHDYLYKPWFILHTDAQVSFDLRVLGRDESTLTLSNFRLPLNVPILRLFLGRQHRLTSRC